MTSISLIHLKADGPLSSTYKPSALLALTHESGQTGVVAGGQQRALQDAAVRCPVELAEGYDRWVTCSAHCPPDLVKFNV